MKQFRTWFILLLSGCASTAQVHEPHLVGSINMTIVSHNGEDIPALKQVLAVDQVTVLDFFADWCAPCEEVTRHLQSVCKSHPDLAVRQFNIVTWDSPIATHYLAHVSALPYVQVYDKHGKFVDEISGLDLGALDNSIHRALAH